MKEERNNLIVGYDQINTKDVDELITQLQREKKRNNELRSYYNKAKQCNTEEASITSVRDSILCPDNNVNFNGQKLEYQLKESDERIKNLERYLGFDDIKKTNTIDEMCKMDDIDETVGKSVQLEDDEDCPRVIILHDALCNGINESIMSREKVVTKKVYTDSLNEIKQNLDDITTADVIVLQALTNSLPFLTCDEITCLIKDATTIALSKAKRVVISTIIARDDDHIIKVKAELLNAIIKYNYRNEPKVVICNNDNLKSRKFRVGDGIHLSPHGVSLLAVNLKHKIAEALGIEVFKKPARSFERSVNGLNGYDSRYCRQRYRCNEW